MILKLFCYFIFTTKYLLLSVYGRTPMYCLHQFNRSDCGGPPTPQFAYWKPGSRCEIQVWRGCPTYNKFDDEMSCSDFCIGKLRFEDNEVDTNIQAIDDQGDPCKAEFDTNYCGRGPTSVYTFNKTTKSCQKANWRGCRTSNKFSSENQCMKACMLNVDKTASKWEDEMHRLTEDDVRAMNKFIDELLNNETTTVMALIDDIPESTTSSEALSTKMPTTTMDSPTTVPSTMMDSETTLSTTSADATETTTVFDMTFLMGEGQGSVEEVESV